MSKTCNYKNPITRLRDWLEPEYDSTPFAKREKVRGVFVSLVIALVIWVFMSNVLTLFLLSLLSLALLLAHGPVGYIDKMVHLFSWKMSYAPTFGFALYVEFLSHGTAYLAYLAARHWPSMTRVLLWPMIGRRHYCGDMGGSDRINRINIMGY